MTGLASEVSVQSQNPNQTAEQANQLAQAIPMIRQQIADTIQSVKAQEEQIMQKMVQLQQQNDQLKEKLNRLNQQVNPSSTAITPSANTTASQGPSCRLTPVQANTASQNPSSSSSGYVPGKPSPKVINNKPQPSLSSKNSFSAYLDRIDWQKTGALIAIIALILVGVFTSLLFFRKKQKLALNSNFEELSEISLDKSDSISQDKEVPSFTHFEEEEYDFLNTDEAIPLRLDLARAYLEMENYVEAKTALQTVLEKGTQEQKLEAKELMAYIDSLV